ncbi:MAG: hypothetical protein ACLQUT_03430 [Thermoleophilia bacterium]
MTVIRQHIDVDAPRSAVESMWAYFVHWVITSHAKLACDDLVCIDVVHSSHINFDDITEGRTRVVFELEAADNSSVPLSDIESRVVHDLEAFQEYIAHPEGDSKQLLVAERAAREGEAGVRRHREQDSNLAPNDGKIFWRR